MREAGWYWVLQTEESDWEPLEYYGDDMGGWCGNWYDSDVDLFLIGPKIEEPEE